MIGRGARFADTKLLVEDIGTFAPLIIIHFQYPENRQGILTQFAMHILMRQWVSPRENSN